MECYRIILLYDQAVYLHVINNGKERQVQQKRSRRKKEEGRKKNP